MLKQSVSDHYTWEITWSQLYYIQSCRQTTIPFSVRSASITASKGGGSIALAKNWPIPPSRSNLMLKAISWSGVRNISGVIWVWSLEWEENKKALLPVFISHASQFSSQCKFTMKCTEGIALTSPLPSMVSSMSWPHTESAWLKPHLQHGCVQPHTCPLTIISYIATEGLPLLGQTTCFQRDIRTNTSLLVLLSAPNHPTPPACFWFDH